MRYASVCDGIGAAHAAWSPLGWRCAWTSEIDPFPAAVVERRWGLPNLGDMTAITESDLERHGCVDVLVGGTPCQSFSVAGLRGGLDDPRGNLALRFVQLAGVLRPRWVVWENVPGVLSSNRGRDFGSLLGALGQLGYGFAYRVLDAQFAGVPQRRRRVLLVGHLGDWRGACAVLLERHGLCGHPPPRRTAGAEVAGALGSGAAGGGWRDDLDRAGAFIAFDTTQITSGINCSNPKSGDPCHPLAAGAYAPAVAFAVGSCHRGVGQGHNTTYIGAGMAVRRLTPRECERLQGFEDGYTLIDYRGKPAADTPRNRALGNSMAVPVMRWIGERIAMVDRILSTEAAA